MINGGLYLPDDILSLLYSPSPSSDEKAEEPFQSDDDEIPFKEGYQNKDN